MAVSSVPGFISIPFGFQLPKTKPTDSTGADSRVWESAPGLAAAVVCGSCGAELPPNSKFCNECGAILFPPQQGLQTHSEKVPVTPAGPSAAFCWSSVDERRNTSVSRLGACGVQRGGKGRSTS